MTNQRVHASLVPQPEDRKTGHEELLHPAVLLAEDDASTRMRMSRKLQNAGYEVIECSNGREVLEACANKLPDLVLLDAMMPELNGFETCEKLADLYDTDAMPILMVTSLEDEESVAKAFAAGTSDYINKPINWPVLLKRVDRLVAACRTRKTLEAERKQAEKERALVQVRLNQMYKMEAIGRLAGGIAHDFNNILASILGFSELTRLGMERGADPERLINNIDQVIEAGKKARDLVSSMMIFARQEEVRIEEMNVANVVGEIMTILEKLIPAGIRIEADLPEQAMLARVDPVRLHQVIMNLCINARDAMNGEGVLQVRVERQEQVSLECSSCHCEFTGDYIVLTISDTGGGIDEEILANMFEPFFTTKDVGRGTGMGLSIVHGAVHDLGGHIEVTASNGAGASFRVCLPCSNRDF